MPVIDLRGADALQLGVCTMTDVVALEVGVCEMTEVLALEVGVCEMTDAVMQYEAAPQS